MAQSTTSPERKPRRLLRWIGVVFGGLLLLLVVGYFVGTSGWFLKSVILPKVGAGMNAKFTVEDASISLFSSVTLRNFRVETKGPEPLVTAQEVRLRYSLMDIIKGNINVSEVALAKPSVTLVTYPDGSSNLDPITKGEKKQVETKEKKPSEKKESKPPQVNLGSLALTDAVIKKIDQRKDGTQQVLVLSVPSLTVNNVGNDKVGKLALSASAQLDQGLKTSSNGVFAAAITGAFDLALDAALKPKTVKGQTKLDVTEGKGAFAQAAGLGAVLNADLTPAQLNDISLRLTQGGKNLTAVSASGPFDPEKMEGKLNVIISQIDRQVLNIAGAASGVDFNQTVISSTNTIELSQRGRVVAINGQVLIGALSLTQKGQTTPPLDIRAAYGVTYDQTNKTALLQSFALNGMQNGSEFLRGGLAKPMLLDLGKGSNAVDESAFDLVITNFNLPDWKAFAGTNVSLAAGKLGVTVNLLSRQAGRQIDLNFATRLNNLTAASGSNRIDNADIALDARGSIQDLSAVTLEQYRVALARAGQQALVASGALKYNTKSQDADVQANLDVMLPQVAALVLIPGLTISDGTVKFGGRVVQKNTTPQQTNNPVLERSVAGKLNVANFTAALASNRFDRFAADLDVDLTARGDQIDIKKFGGALHQSGQPGGAFDVSGGYNTANRAGQIIAALKDLNQNTLKSFLAAALGDKQLESVTINANTTAKLDGATDGSVKAELHVANLVVNDPSGAVPRSPLAVDLSADIAMAKQVYDLKTVQLALTKTERAPNSINLSGRFDTSKSNAYTGNLKITSDGLDVTPYYELFANKNTNTAAAGKTAQPSEPKPTAPEKPQTEPEPMKLPVSQFIAEVSIAKFFLREIAISNLVAKSSVENGQIKVDPFSLSLNGAPIAFSTRANVAVPGYEYDVNAKMDRVPLEPLVNTFQPERAGQMKGDLFTSLQIKGAGVTGPNLKKNLQGSIGIILTNGDVKVTQYQWLQRVLRPLATALATPEIAESPLRWIDARVGIGTGTVTITNTTVESSLFRANVPGTVTLNDVITNSILNNLPVQLEFRKALVGKIKYLPTTGISGDWVGMPDFYTIGGTIGKPDPHVDKVALTKIAAGEVLKNVGGDAGKFLRGIGIGGGSTNAPSGTNATNSSVGSLLQGFLGGQKSATATTNQAAQTNAPTTNSVGNLLRGLGGFLDKPKDTNAPRRRP